MKINFFVLSLFFLLSVFGDKHQIVNLTSSPRSSKDWEKSLKEETEKINTFSSSQDRNFMDILTTLIPDGSEKRLTAKDFSIFYRLEELVAFEKSTALPDHAPPRWSLEEFAAYLEQGEIAMGIYDRTTLIAFYIFLPKEHSLYITEVGVHPNYRGKGLGRYILKRIEEEGEQRGISTYSLTVDPYNGSAIKLYLKNGFVVTSFKRGCFGPDHPNTHRLLLEKFPSLKKEIFSSSKKIEVYEFDKIQEACKEGFIGTTLILSKDKNAKKNLILFEKTSYSK